jgi:predicted GNAT superfamily acetyltransferase
MAHDVPNIIVRPLKGPTEYAACVALQERTWGEGFAERVPATILRIAQEMGGIASGAFDESGRLLGFVFGMTGWVDRSPVHWSDMLAVAPAARNSGVGTALKLHQREMLLERGVEIMRWTFDPLQARNGYLNLSRLGAVARAYGRDYYEQSDSPLHAIIGTDRLIVTWEMAGERATRRVAGHEMPPGRHDVEHLPLLNPLLAGTPVECAQPHEVPDVAAVRIAVPTDISAIRDDDPERALRWRLRTRAAFESALNTGFEVRELVRAGEVGWYVLVRGSAQ